MYGFYDECKRRTNIKTWKTFIDVFNTLPIASIVASKIFCVHGGLSPSLKSMDDIRRIVRPTGTCALRVAPWDCGMRGGRKRCT